MRHCFKRISAVLLVFALMASAAAVSFAASYDIRLSQTGTYTFPDRDYGYSQVSARSVTVTNIGDYATGRLEIDLLGVDADCFTLSRYSLESISRNGSASFTVRPVTGLTEGTYQATVEVTGRDGIYEWFDVRFSVDRYYSSSYDSYDIRLSQTGTYIFPDRDAGYSQVSARSVTITNVGDYATGRLTLDIRGEDADCFTLSRSSISSIPRNGSDSFTVRPVNGLSEGTYFATIEVIGDRGAYEWFNVRFTVGRSVPSYGVRLSQTGTYTFSDRDSGYGQITARRITVTNTLSQSTGELSIDLIGRDAYSFELSSDSIPSIARNGTDSFTVRPVTGLGSGAYFATVEVTGRNGIYASFNVSFTVTYDGRWPDDSGYWWDSGYLWWDSDFYFTAGSTYITGSGTPYAIVVRRDYQRFRSISLGGFALTQNNQYSARATSGFTEISFLNSYLDTLPAGTHTLTVRFSDRTVTATFTVAGTASSWYAGGHGLNTASATGQLNIRPYDYVTQGDIIDALYRIAGSPSMVSKQGLPLTGSDAAFTWVLSRGILPSNGLYEQGSYATRQDVAILMSRLADALRLSLPAIRGSHYFRDESSIDPRARRAVSELYMAGVFNGRTADTFDPYGYMTRSQFATVIQRFAEAVK